MPLNENINFFGSAYTQHLFCVLFKLICAVYFKERMFVDELVTVGGDHCVNINACRKYAEMCF